MLGTNHTVPPVPIHAVFPPINGIPIPCLPVFHSRTRSKISKPHQTRPERINIRPPSMAETRAILKAAEPHLVRFIKLSYYLGVRPGAVELLGLTWDAVNWDTNTIEVISAEKGGMVRRHVPIHDGFAAELKSWWKADNKTGPIIRYRDKPVGSIKTAWENTLIRAKIKRRLRPYDLRHNFITAALEEGADIGAVAAIVGSSPETLRRHYQHVTNRLRRQTVALIKQIEE